MNALIIRQSLFVITLLAASTAFGGAAVIEQQIDKLIPVFESGTLPKIKSATDTLSYSGISSSRLFDVAETRMMKGYTRDDKPDIEMTGWLIKAISYSGNSNYQSVLQKITTSHAPKKVRGYAQKGLLTLQQYASWNPEISANLDGLDAGQADIQRVKNMLASSSYDLVRAGAKRIYYAHNDNAELLKLAEERLLKEYKTKSNENVFVDAMAWLCKALAVSSDVSYTATLQKVASDSPSRKVQKYAKRYLR